MSRLRKFWSLARREKCLLIEASILLLLSALCVKLFPFKRIYSFLWDRYGYVKVGAHEASSYESEIKLIDRSISRAVNRFPWETLCLSRSIAEFVMLRRRDIPAVMFAGVRFSDQSLLDAHAWVETGLGENNRNNENSGFTTVIRIGNANN